MEERYLTREDGHRLFLRVWRAPETKATVHINHGMAEHSLRYARFAEYLNKFGITVYAQDHRGHGFTKEEDEKGWFAEHGGWQLVASDAYFVDQIVERENPGVPHFLFGHSMGSFVARTCLADHSDAYDAAVICGTGASQGIIGRIGKKIAERNARKNGSKTPDRMMEALAFGSYAKHFKGEGSTAWLSKDKAEVALYDNDPLCGFLCSSQFYADLIEGSFTANDKERARRIRKDIPILIISGDDDPVGDYGKGVKRVYKLYKDAGIEDVTLILHPGDRHEILNETDRDLVMKEIADFLLLNMGDK